MNTQWVMRWLVPWFTQIHTDSCTGSRKGSSTHSHNDSQTHAQAHALIPLQTHAMTYLQTRTQAHASDPSGCTTERLISTTGIKDAQDEAKQMVLAQRGMKRFALGTHPCPSLASSKCPLCLGGGGATNFTAGLLWKGRYGGVGVPPWQPPSSMCRIQHPTRFAMVGWDNSHLPQPLQTTHDTVQWKHGDAWNPCWRQGPWSFVKFDSKFTQKSICQFLKMVSLEALLHWAPHELQST